MQHDFEGMIHVAGAPDPIEWLVGRNVVFDKKDEQPAYEITAHLMYWSTLYDFRTQRRYHKDCQKRFEDGFSYNCVENTGKDLSKHALKYDDDIDYGSNFTLMIKLISDLFHDTVLENIEEIHTRSHPLDDGQSWNEYPFIGRPEFEDIIICHAVHQLTDHQLYSIPDLIRLNDFWAEVHLTIQSITEQDGTRFIPNKKTHNIP